MKVRTMCACVSTALLISVSTSTVFADVTQVTDRGSLIPSDSIYWDVQGDESDVFPHDCFKVLTDLNWGTTLNVPNVISSNGIPTSSNGISVAVSQTTDPDMDIQREPGTCFLESLFDTGDYILATFNTDSNNPVNTLTFNFSDPDSEKICGFGTQIVPFDYGVFIAEIQAFDGDDPMVGSPVVVNGSNPDPLDENTELPLPSAPFIGLSSTTPITSVEVAIITAGDGNSNFTWYYAINQVTLTYCSDLPAPALTLDKTSDVDTYSAIGDLINYSYDVTSSGTGPVVGPITVSDNKVTVSCPPVDTVGNNDNNLDPAEALTCSASHTVVQADIIAASITNTATAAGDAGATESATAELTVNYQSPVPALECSGFAAPMANYPVKAKKNRTFPLKMELFDGNWLAQTDELIAAPVVVIDFASSTIIEAVDVSRDALSFGQGSDGNKFELTDDDIWQFNLKSKGYQEGTYIVTVTSGNDLEYTINPTCRTSFTIK